SRGRPRSFRRTGHHSTRRQDTGVKTMPQEGVNQPGASVEEVLAIVEEQQHLARGQRRGSVVRTGWGGTSRIPRTDATMFGTASGSARGANSTGRPPPGSRCVVAPTPLAQRDDRPFWRRERFLDARQLPARLAPLLLAGGPRPEIAPCRAKGGFA